MKEWSEEAWNRIDEVLDEVLDRPPDERAAFLDAVCADAPELRRQVEALIEAEEEAPDFLESDAAALLTSASFADPSSEKQHAGRRVGAYRLIEEIGRGGMSRVYRAERADGAFEQEVAVKLLPIGLDTPESRHRFRVEQQVLADLQHPNIAQLLDGGVTDDDVPYLVMEHIKGQPITTYCDERHLSVRERLELLTTVGDALQYAHRNLVVHRDLKPDNILVTDEGQVKLLDFGIAKLMDAEGVSVTAPVTQTGVRPMTPAYAAPEQVRGEAISAATDVYQLGVLTYELLTGHRPFESAAGSRFEMERAVLEEQPTVPSTAITRIEERSEDGTTVEITPEQVSGARDTSAERLQRLLRGDLDAVVLQALSKEPDDRYASAEAFVTDVERYLEGRPVEARQITPAYRLRKFIQRHQSGVAATAAFVVLVAVFIITLAWQQRQTAQQRDRAQQEAQKAEQVSEFLVGLFEASNPMEAANDSVTARELLQQGLDRVARLDEQPSVQAEMFDAMGRAHLGLGHYEMADSLLRRALTLRRREYSAPSPELAASLDHLSRALDGLGEYAAAESLAHEALGMRRAVRARPHPDVAESLHHLAFYKKQQGEYAPAESLYHEALSMRQQIYEPPHRDVAATMSNLGQLHTERGNYAAAESLHREALAMRHELLGRVHPKTGESFNNLAQTVEQQGRLDEAEALYRQALTVDRKTLGAKHPIVAIDLNNLAVVQEKQGEFAAAESLKRKSLAMRRALLGADHPDVTTSLNNLAVLLRKKGNYEKAAALFERVLNRLERQYGGAHPYVAFTLGNLAETRADQGRYAAADSLHRASLAMLKTVFDPKHPHVAAALENIADLREKQGRYEDAKQWQQQALTLRREALGSSHPKTAESLSGMADLLVQQGKPEQAETLYREAIAINKKVLPEDDWRRAYIRNKLGACLAEQGRHAIAESILRTSYETLRQQRGPEDTYTQTAARNLVALYEAWNKPQKAITHRDSLLADGVPAS